MTTVRGRGRTLVATAVVAAVALAGCTGTEGVSDPPGTTPGSAPVDLGEVRLVSHDSCDGLLDWFHTEAGARVGPYGLEGEGPTITWFEDSASAAEGSASDTAAALPPNTTRSSADGNSSTTNTQEPGVGELDLAWTDGTRLVTVVTGDLEVVGLDAGAVASTVELPDSDEGATVVGLMVEDGHALVVQEVDPAWDEPVASDGAADSSLPVPGEPRTRLVRVDLDPTPTIVGTTTVDGAHVDARMVDGVVRTVVRSSPTQLGFVYPAGGGQAATERALEVNRDIVASTTIDDWLPSMAVDPEGREGTNRKAAECTAVDHPAEFGGFDVVTVIGLDLAAGAVDPLPSAAVVADAQTVYGSTEGLYVATTRWPDVTIQDDGTAATTTVPGGSTASPVERTDVHAFSLPADAAARYEASGSVEGSLLGQFALSEHDGDLRVASTVNPAWNGPIPVEPDGGPAIAPGPGTVPDGGTVSTSRVTVLRPAGERLEQVGLVDGLGPTEQIRGVRFAGDTAYVVTFRQTDPLYVVDLRNPEAPTVAGQLKIPGYSSYLQVLGEGRVLGLGQDATDTGRTTGFQESLFDVSDPASPTRTAQLVVPGAYSTAESDHHALLWWAPTGLLAVPVERRGAPEGGVPTTGVLVTRIGDASIEEVGTISHPDSVDGGTSLPCERGVDCLAPQEEYSYPTPIQRTLVADGRLVTVSSAGVKVSDLGTLAEQAWIPFA